MPDNSDKPSKLDTLKRAFVQLETLQAKLKAFESEPIAVVGMGCRFPGDANSAESFWDLMVNGRNAVVEIPWQRWDVDAYYDPDPETPGKMVTRWGAFLEGIDQFDSQLFGISPREAVSMDPQQRLLMEVAWEALENAGQAADNLSGTRTGVFVGIIGSEYAHLQTSGEGIRHIDTYFGSGAANSIASGRISYAFGLQGPSLSIDTSCSSSLVAVHLACQSLRSQECSMALAGGVNLMLLPDATIILTKHKLMAADGRCKTFDQTADGYVRGEGCGIVVLKRLSDALKDGDRILGLIRGTAANQDGPSSGLTAPHGPSQQAVIRSALKNAGIKPADVGYIETHGTGTALGDPIEVQALSAVVKEDRPADRPVYIGAVKTNIGHLEAAAGIASLIKVLIMLRNKEIPPHLHMNIPNPHIPWNQLPVAVAHQRTPWPNSYPLVAGVSSFGFSGTNVHMVLEGYQPMDRAACPNDRPIHLLGLSARTKDALADLVGHYQRSISRNPDLPLGDLCFSANTGRAKLPQRMAIRANSIPHLQKALKSVAEGNPFPGVAQGACESGEPPKVAFLFSGQGVQYVNMGRQLFETQPVFRATLQKCSSILESQQGFDLISLLYPGGTQPADTGSNIHQTAYAQPSLFAMECALMALWRSWGVEPTAVMGHSLGEYSAAVAAGIFSLEDGLRFVGERARLMQSLPQGGQMAAIFTGEDQVARAIVGRTSGSVSIAAVNGPLHVVVSGEKEGVGRLIRFFSSEGIKAKQLNVSHAFHSTLVDPVLERLESLAAKVAFSEPQIHLISNLTGKKATRGEMTTPTYWKRHLRSPVLFSSSVKTLYEMGYRIFIEIGPHPVLCGMAANCLPEQEISWLPSMRWERDNWEQILDSLAQLYVKGARIDWAGFDQPFGRRRVSLPTYPFQRRRFWPDGISVKKGHPRSGKPIHPLLGYHVSSALREILFETSLSLHDFEFVHDHKVNGTTLVPATAFIEMASAGAKAVCGTEAVELEDFIIHRPMIIEDNDTRIVQTIITPEPEGAYFFKICSCKPTSGPSAESAPVGGEIWTIHVSGRIRKAREEVYRPSPLELPFTELMDICSEEISKNTHYSKLATRGFNFGPALQGVSLIKRGQKEALGQIRLPKESGQTMDGYGFHPALLDACLQFFWAILPEGMGSDSYLPMSFQRYRVYSAPDTEIWSHISYRSASKNEQDTLEGDVRIFDLSGKVVAAMDRLCFRQASLDKILGISASDIDAWFYQLEWKASAAPKTMVSDGREGPRPSDGFVPSIDLIADHVEKTMQTLQETEDLVSHHRLVNDIETLSGTYVVEALTALGFEFRLGQRFSEERLLMDAGIAERYRGLLHRLLQIVAQAGLLKQSGNEWEIVGKPQPDTSKLQLNRLLSNPAARNSAQLELTMRCGERLAQTLTGKADPLALLFPNGSLAIAARLYSESPEARVFNSLVREAVQKAQLSIPQGRKARILELGAGTGGATSFVLPGLKTDQVEYVFTDLSPVFLNQAELRFKDYPFVTYRLCNIEKGPEEQSFDSNSFDIVIGMNMIHATRDLRHSLQNIHKFLVPGGVLILLEGTAPERWIDITFGLTDGWWAFTDKELRPDYPLLSRATWLNVLQETGYANGVAAPGSSDLSHEALIMAQKPANTSDQAPQNQSAGSKWMILSDDLGLGAKLVEGLEAIGRGCIWVTAGEQFDKKSEQRWCIRFDQREDFQRLFSELNLQGDSGLIQIVHMTSGNGDITGNGEIRDLAKLLELNSRSTLFLLQAMLSEPGWDQPPKLCIVTCGAQPAGSMASVTAAQAPAWGMSKVIELEHPDLACRCIDLDPEASLDHNVAALIGELSTPDQENLTAIREGRRMVPRLKRVNIPGAVDSADTAADKPKLIRLEKSVSGILDELNLKSVEAAEPGPDQVQIRIHAAGLSFRDVMNALSLRDDPEPLGSECSGIIIKVGQRVNELSVGDAVIALASGSIGTLVNANAEFVIPKPEGMSFEKAATLPTAFLTAHYALNHLARICKGERVLIHAAAGGVGMAALRFALAAGAEVYGTAGSRRKREYLRALGVKQAMDSRTAEFKEKIMELTGGKGVDVILNSLAGELITQSLSVLAPQGRFLEIGKRDILSPEQAHRLRPDITYHIVDLAVSSYEDPALIRKLFQEVVAKAREGTISALPMRVFPLSEASSAFRFMSQSKHIGKIIIKNDRLANPAATIHSNATYLITGGLSGLGLLVAQWLVERGAKHLVLMARSPAGPTVNEKISELEQKGVAVRTFQADVSVMDQVAFCLGKIDARMPPLRGIIHSAGVLADSVLMNQSWEQFHTVYKPKIYGSWNLHTLTKEIDLDFFVLFSSTAGLLGSTGQSNHASANAFLDALAHHRRRIGLPAVSINWGVWSGVGSAAKKRADEWVALQGVGVITPQKGIQALERILGSNHTQIAVVPVDWSVFLEKYAGGCTPAWLSELRPVEKVPHFGRPFEKIRAKTAARDVLDVLSRLPTAKRRNTLMDVVQAHTAAVLGLSNPDEIDPARPLNEQGVDSLMAVELRNMLGKGLGLQKGLPATLVFDYPTIETLTDFLFSLTPFCEKEQKRGDPDDSRDPDDLIDALEDLSDEAVDRLLREQAEGQ